MTSPTGWNFSALVTTLIKRTGGIWVRDALARELRDMDSLVT